MAAMLHDEQAIFEVARKIGSGEAREAYLRQICANDAAIGQRVRDLLKAYEEGASFLESPADAVGGTGAFTPDARNESDSVLPRECAGVIIGPYKLLQQIGEGGMGTVYMAEQAHPIQRKVALKIIKAGMDSKQVIARFEAERQALAMMDHVNIARVFDAGTMESGQPYFVMELVHGVPITKYCDDNHLTPRQRLELFVPVCQAIQHAHQKGIIHRDIKPSNVMVTLYDGKPVPKVIDFGVAKATEQNLTERTMFTQYGTMVGTLEYMSPEQAEMSALGVDTRSDIYSLGVLLYELLTGNTPLTHRRMKEGVYAEILRMIKEEEPQKPSTRLSDSGEALASISANRHMEPAKLSKLMRGELDWIVMKTLEKDRNRRYETAKDFADDVQRYLADEAVLACPPSAGYRLRKFVRRNKGAVAATFAAMMVVLLALVGQAVSNVFITHERNEKIKALEQAQINEREATEQRTDAEENLRQALAAVDRMLTRVGVETLYGVPGMDLVRRELLQDALQFYQSFLARKHNDPRIRREVALAYINLGVIHRGLGRTADSEADYRKALALVDALAVEGPPDPDFRAKLVSGYIGFATTVGLLGKAEEREHNLRLAVKIAEDLVKEFPNQPVYATKLTGANYFLAAILSEPEEAKEILRRNLTLTSSPWQLRWSYNLLGRLALNQGNYADAEKAYREAALLADAAAAERAWDLSGQYYRCETLAGLAQTVAGSGRLQEASTISGPVMAIMDKLAADHPQILQWREVHARMLGNHAKILEQLDRIVEAEAAYRKSFAISIQVVSANPNLGENQQQAWLRGRLLGKFLLKNDQIEDAQEVYTQAAPFLEKHPGNAPTKLKLWEELFRANLDLGRQLAKKGNAAKSEAAFQQATVIQDRLKNEFSADNRHLVHLAEGVATASESLRNAGMATEANRFAGQARELISVAGPLPETWDSWHKRGLAYAALGEWDKALADQTKALELRPDSVASLWRHGQANVNLKRWDDAVADFTRAIELDPDVPGSWHFRGYAYANLSQWDKALADLTRAAEFVDVNWQVWSRRGDVYGALKQWDRAIADYEKAIEMGARVPSIWVSKAAAHAQSDHADKAIADLQQAITRGLRSATQLKTMPGLAPLRSRDDFKKLVAELEAKKK